MDGGIQRGTHVLKALSLGAKAVGVGRFYLYPLAAAGQAGVERALGLMRTEIERGHEADGLLVDRPALTRKPAVQIIPLPSSRPKIPRASHDLYPCPARSQGYARPHQPVVGHPDASDAGDARSDGAGRGRRRAGRRRSDRQPVVRPRGRSARQGSRRVHALGHHVQRHGYPVLVPAGRRDPGACQRPYHRPRRRRACSPWRLPDHAAAGRRRTIFAGDASRRPPPALALPAAADHGQRRADRQYRRRHDLEEGRAR